MKKCSGKAFSEVWTMFSSAQKAKGVSDITLRNYRQHLHNISKHFDIEMPFDELSKSKFEDMVSKVFHNFFVIMVSRPPLRIR